MARRVIWVGSSLEMFCHEKEKSNKTLRLGIAKNIIRLPAGGYKKRSQSSWFSTCCSLTDQQALENEILRKFNIAIFIYNLQLFNYPIQLLQIVIAMVACAVASDVPELTPAQKVATDFHAAAHAAATTVALGGAAPSFFQPDAPDVHFTKMAHLNQLSYETARNYGYHYGAYPYATAYGAYPYHYGAGHLALRKKRQVPEQTPEVQAATAFHLMAKDAAYRGFPVHAGVLDTPAVHFAKLDHFARYNYEAARNGAPLGTYGGYAGYVL